jgi:hypothetical protein
MEDKIFWVFLSDRKVWTSTWGGCIICEEVIGARRCNEEIFFAVSDGFSPEDARRKFLPLA